ncbi:DUF1985 domain-containing protein [Abeliophyllum distichum]|uniref:DUF1985 domain-containing protein n=1 Tax=Abeliophyllum distichum TaxID=126358 RepID=A0ABD1PDG6_9LAMI
MFTTAYKRSVEDLLMVLVDSDEMNAYAWGKELFKLTLSSLKSSLRNKSLIVEGDGRPYIAYRINGFVIAFQVWIYEILPILEGKLQVTPVKATNHEKQQLFTFGFYSGIAAQLVEDSEDDFMYPMSRRSMRGKNNKPPVASTSNSIQRVDYPAKERCNSNDILKRCFSEIHRKHEVLVAEHFRLKFHFEYLCNEFAKSIADGLIEVNRLCAAKQSPLSKMASSYKKSYAANMKVHANAMNTDSQHLGLSLKGRWMRPCKTKTIDEDECPSFDLGIDSQLNVPYIEPDDVILRTQDDIIIIDDTVIGKIPESYQTDDRVESSNKRKYISPIVECSDAGCNLCISKSSSEFLDDDLVFTEEDLRNMDESVEKHVVGSHKVTSQALTPIPFVMDDSNTPKINKRLRRPTACIQSPFVQSFQSQPGCPSIDLPPFFEYKMFLDPPDSSHIRTFDKWYHIGLRPGNK